MAGGPSCRSAPTAHFGQYARAMRVPLAEGRAAKGDLGTSVQPFAGLATIAPHFRASGRNSRRPGVWARSDPPLKKVSSAGAFRLCSLAWQREQSVTRSSSRLDPSTAWWTDSRSAEPQRTQRFRSRSRAARRSRCQAERLSSGRDEPERWGFLHAWHLPGPSGGRRTPQFGQTRARLNAASTPEARIEAVSPPWTSRESSA